MNNRLTLIILLLLPVGLKAQSPFKGFENLFTPPKVYVVNYVKTPPVIDGDINDAVWQQAAWTDNFRDIEGDLKPEPKLRTNVKMLWGDTCLYIAARIMDPHVWANIKQHDEIVFFDNDFEVFIDPNNTTHQYFEMEFNARNTLFDLFLNKPYRDGGSAMFGWNAGLRSAVKVQGTINNPGDTDKGWTIEMAIPYRAISIGNNIQTPVDGATWRINFSRVEWDTNVVDGKYVKAKDSNGRDLPEHNWVWSAQGVINMHYPERWGYLQFTKSAGKPVVFSLPVAEQQKNYLWLIYYKEKEWADERGVYNVDLKSLDMAENLTVGTHPNTLKLEATAHQFIAYITDNTDHTTWSINHDGLISQLK